MLAVVLAAVLTQAVGAPSGFGTCMRSPKLREVAACTAAQAARLPGEDEKCVVNHVIETVGPLGKPVFMIFFGHDWGSGGPGKALGHFEVFDEGGRHLDWFANANVLDDGDTVFVAARAPAMVVQHILLEPSCGRATSEASALMVQSVHVISLASPDRPLLSVFVGPPTRETYVVRTFPQKCETSTLGDVSSTICGSNEERAPAFEWSWGAACASGKCRLAIGPTKELKSGRSMAEFRWSPGCRLSEGWDPGFSKPFPPGPSRRVTGTSCLM
ncbi:MAG: hypothetical protein Q8S33_26080 [Myxococcales bacterium]|nr:hypothetical protein [Myxococcales bacterium]